MFRRAMQDAADRADHTTAPAPRRGGQRHVIRTEEAVPIGGAGLAGTLSLLPGARGLVIWVGHAAALAEARAGRPGHGEGAAAQGDQVDFPRLLAAQGLATLSLAHHARPAAGLRPGSDDDPAHFAAQAVEALDWAATQHDLKALATGFCACGAAAAGALLATTQRPARVEALVAASARVELAAAALSRVAVPTLLVVGGNDIAALAANRAALPALHCEKRLEVVPGAGARFEEPGARATLTHLAASWLAARLGSGAVRH